MSYVSLYRKWRSQSFDDIVGQKHIIKTLKNAISQNRIAHAYLFCGPRGTGKTSIARIFAKALNCENGPTVSPCTTCANCTKIRDGHSVDVTEIDAASNRGIDEIRDLREKVRYAPVEGKYKVYIIDEVHMLTSEAFNALLKTLEEPPSHVIFILATTEPAKIPVTIESRCQRLDFSRISLEEIKQHLKKISAAESIKIEEPALDLVARSGEGSMRDCVSLLDQLSSYAGNNISIDNVVELLGCADEAMLFNMADSLARCDIASALNTLREGIDRGRSASQIVRDMISHFRNLLFIKLSAHEALELTKDYLERLKKQSGSFSLDAVKKIIRALSRAELDMKWHPHARLVLEVALLELQEENPLSSLPLSKGEMSEHRSDRGGKVAADPRLTEIKSKWSQILEEVKKKSLYGYVSLHEGDPILADDTGRLVISFRKGYAFHKDRLEEAKNKQAVEDIITQVMGHPVKIECKILDDVNNAKPLITVDAVREIFEGELVK
ncbi:DNA polymerase III subunit gamma/tau [Candidatus Saganbacteria bacterium]|nr:DNA polymerase III subunit gamma/tau [Candidatus Saganbacteria bacterium]